jgi:hypothetical protein
MWTDRGSNAGRRGGKQASHAVVRCAWETGNKEAKFHLCWIKPDNKDVCQTGGIAPHIPKLVTILDTRNAHRISAMNVNKMVTLDS